MSHSFGSVYQLIPSFVVVLLLYNFCAPFCEESSVMSSIADTAVCECSHQQHGHSGSVDVESVRYIFTDSQLIKFVSVKSTSGWFGVVMDGVYR